MSTHRSLKPWVPVPAENLLDFLKNLSWKKIENFSVARDVACLMVYICLLYYRENSNSNDLIGFPKPSTDSIVDLTYNEILEVTGLSRSLINQGISRLIELRIIEAIGSNQNRMYRISWPIGRWFKLPCRPLIKRDSGSPFKHFTLRSKHELNALKLYLYLGSIRSGGLPYSQASYEKINEQLGIQERDIRRAINCLNASGLVDKVNRESDRAKAQWGPNQYYLTGHNVLV